ncbi:hypothetical protein DFO55_101727 [Grimontella sp. AG753]|nr:hypothetical protein DFO55_101727 [Grimontella sp. AG753]
MESVNKIIQEINATKGRREYCNSLHLTLSGDGYVRPIVDWTRVTKPERIDVLIAHVEKQDSELQSLRKQLVAVTEQRDALVVEASSMHAAIEKTISWQQSVDAGNTESVRMLLDLKTPSTSSAIAALRAEGVEMFAESLKVVGSGEHPYAAVAREFARQLRESKGANHE